MKIFFKILVLFAVVLISMGCSEEDLNSIQIQLKEDGSGSLLFVESRIFDNASNTVHNSLRGMDWQSDGVRVVVRKATFNKIEHVEISGIKAEVKDNKLKVIIPIGPEAAWPDVLMPIQRGAVEIRQEARDLGFNVPQKEKRSFKFVVTLPGSVVAQGTYPKLSQTSQILPGASGSPNKAELVLPIDRVLESKEKELLWEVTWK